MLLNSILLLRVNADLYGMSVTPAGLESVEEPEGEVADQQEGHHLPPGLGGGNSLGAGEPEESLLDILARTRFSYRQEASRINTVCSVAWTRVNNEARNSTRWVSN